jgi:dihydrofolate synthase/folylpolyglutamate synthase
MPGSPRVLLDGAHNPEKIEALASALRAIYPEEQFTLVVGLLKTKDAEAALRAFKGLARRVITTDPSVKGKPAIPVEELAGLMRRMGWGDVTPVAEPLSALNLAIKVTAHDDLIIVAGSLFLVGMIRAYWHPNRQIEAQQTMFTT